jgi:CubicO group peptidase (beta-lactamase class C family)
MRPVNLESWSNAVVRLTLVVKARTEARGYSVQNVIRGMRLIFVFVLMLLVSVDPARSSIEQEGANERGMPAGNSIASGERPGSRIANAVLQPFVDAHILAGAVTLVATENKILDLEAVGFADLKTKTPMRTDDVFWIASMTKPMTATAVMMLVDEGKIRLNDPVEKYLPEFKGQPVLEQQPVAGGKQKENARAMRVESAQHPIRIWEILSHTSGLPFSSEKEPGALDLLPLKQAVRWYAAEPLLFQPGTRFEYSNEGINTAARIVEVVSGMSYAEFMQRRLFGPLGMKDTTFWPDRQRIARLAKVYKASSDATMLEETRIDQLTYPLDDVKRRYAVPAGGLFSTAIDVMKFCQMILNDGVYQGRRYLSRSAVKEMTSKQTSAAISDSYGFGWYVDSGIFGHPGVYKTNMTIDPQHGIITIFLVQQAGPWRTNQGKNMLRKFTDAAEELALQQAIAH